MDAKDEILGADYAEHGIIQLPMGVERTTNSSSSDGRNDVNIGGISQRSRFTQPNDKMVGVYRTYFTDDLAADRSKAPARENLAYQHEEA